MKSTIKTGSFVRWRNRPQYGILQVKRTSWFGWPLFMPTFKCSGPNLPYEYHWLDPEDLELVVLKNGDKIRLVDNQRLRKNLKNSLL